MRRYLTPILAALLAAAATATAGLATGEHGGSQGRDDEHSGRGYSIGLWGDVPYSDLQKTTGVPNLIADMNRQRLAFSAHDGDLKQGSGSLCDDALYQQAVTYFNSLEAPAVFTPGDNDWTDCDRPSNGGYNSSERLAHERQVLFSTPFTFGQHRMRQEVQAPPYVENRRWNVEGVTYATLNIPGSCNNLCDVAPNPAEWAARNAANINWLHETFQKAKARHDAAVMLIFQVNPGWDNSDATRDVPTRDPKTLVENDANAANDGYRDFLLALRDETIAFRRPVAAVHGDSHYFRVDKPFLDAQGRRLENFTRVETFGDHPDNGNNDVQWVRVDVDPQSREVFSFQPQIVPANRTAVPAP
jgi:hypothetical protein